MIDAAWLERRAMRFDRALDGLEREAVGRLRSALLESERRLERELRRLYRRAVDEGGAAVAMREARARALLAQVRSLLDITDRAPGDVFGELVRRAYANGAEAALALLEPYSRELINLSAVVPVEVVAAASNASASLSAHGRAFAEEAERLIIDGIVRGRGWRDTARELRRETGATLYRAERIVRTESVAASDAARRDTYRANGVEYVQLLATADARVCGYCLARAGRVYRRDELHLPLHANCRCFSLPVRAEWLERGRLDAEWFRGHRAEAARRATEAPKHGVAPSEKRRGLERPPRPVWSP